MKKNFLMFIAVLSMVAAGIAGCGSTGPGPGKVDGIHVAFAQQVTGPIGSGTSVQLVATAMLSSGGTEDVTSLATWTTSNAKVATVSTTGLIDGVGPGTAVITCTYAGETTTITVTIAAALQTITISPANASAAAGTTRAFVAQGTYADGSVTNITAQVAWSSSASSVATISTSGVATAVAAGATTITAKLSGVTATTPFTVSAATVESISVTPSNPSLATGGTLQFRALATFSDGSTQDITSTVTWTSSAPSVASITSAGVASGIGAGTATITASSGTVTATTTLTIKSATLVSITISPSNPSLHAGTSQQFTATGHYSDNSTQNLTSSVTWTSSAPGIISISASGLATASSPGMATITATSGGVTAQVSVAATMSALSSIAVAPSNPSVAAGSSEQFTATGTFADGSTQNLTTSVVWSSSSTATATIDANGLASAVGTGTTTITATYGATSSTTALTVTPATIVSIAITPSNPTFAVGTETQFTATATYSDGSTQDISSEVSWSSSGPAVSITSEGLATGQAVGSGTITGSFGGSTGTTNVSISTATLSSVAIAPNDPSIAAGTSQQFTLTGYFSDGSQQDLTHSATWTSSSGAVTISASGLATGNSTGSATITGTYQGASGMTTITITPATLVSITITPSNPSIAAGTTVQFHAVGTYSDGSTQDLTSTLSWSSSSSAVVSISSTGLATGVGTGNATITGTAGGVTQMVGIAITSATLTSIAVTPQTASVAAGTTQQFTATGTFSDSSTQDLTSQVSWSSSTSAASINSSGLATGAAAGTSTITATYSGTTSNGATLTITAATLQSITVTPSNPSAAAGETAQLAATGHFSDGSTQNVTNSVSWSTSDGTIATVSTTGVVTGKAQGTATITATSGSTMGSVTFTTSAPVLVTLTITPANPGAPSGDSAQLTLTGTFSDGSTQDETHSATWTSSNNNVAGVAQTGVVTAGLQGSAIIEAAIGSVNTSVTFTSAAAVVVSIAVTPSGASVPNGDTQQLTATATYSDGTSANVTTSATWSSGANGTATVNTTGLVTGKAVGTVTITAIAGSVSGNTTVNVIAAVLTSINVSPLNASVPAGAPESYTATGTYSDGSTQNITTSVTWASSNATVATIDSSGTASTKQTGATSISAALNSLGNSTQLTVTAATLTSINVIPSNNPDAYHANSRTVSIGEARAMTPDSAMRAEGLPNLNGIITTIALGTEQQFNAIGTYTDGSTHDITLSAAWSSSLPTIASIESPGLALATAIGSTQVQATQDAQTGATTLNVTPAILASIAIVPVNPSAAAGSTIPFTATGVFTDGSTQDITSTATWTSSSTLVASISAQGIATALVPGTTTIECVQGTTNNSTTLTVTPALLLTIAVTPTAPSLAAGTTQQFTATGTYSDGSTHDLTASAKWTSANPAAATINSTGLATAVAIGTTAITGTVGSISGAATLTVSPAVLTSLTITPPSPSIAAGTVEQFIASGNYSDGTTTVITPLVSWTSSSPSTATIGATGLATGHAMGTSTISATLNGITGSTSLTVTPATLVTIGVTPAVTTVPLGGTVQYTATGTFSDLSTQDLTSVVSWTTSASAVAVITNGGLATSSGTGVATITATSGTTTGTGALTVTSAALDVISITPANASCPAGGTQQLTAVGLYSNNNQLSLTNLAAWSSSIPSKATVSASGLVTCIAAGTPTITATFLGISGTDSLTVTTATLQSITVTAATSSATLGLLDQMTAIGHYSDGSTRDLTSSAVWTVAPALLATVTQTGGLLAVGIGNCTVTATYGGVSGNTTVTLLL